MGEDERLSLELTELDLLGRIVGIILVFIGLFVAMCYTFARGEYHYSIVIFALMLFAIFALWAVMWQKERISRVRRRL